MVDLVDLNQRFDLIFSKIPSVDTSELSHQDIQRILNSADGSMRHHVKKITCTRHKTINVGYRSKVTGEVVNVGLHTIKTDIAVSKKTMMKLKNVNNDDVIQVTDFHSIGIKVKDVVKLYMLANPHLSARLLDKKTTEVPGTSFTYDDIKFIQKIDKAKEYEHLADILYLGKQDDNKNDIPQSPEKFANMLVIIGYADVIHALEKRYTRGEISQMKLQTGCANFIKSLVLQCTEHRIRKLNIVFSLKDLEADINKLITFDEPRSLIEILREYHRDVSMCAKLVNLVKDNPPVKEENKVLLTCVEQLGGKNASVDLSEFDTFYFDRWNIDWIRYLCHLLDHKFQILKFGVDKTQYSSYWDKECRNSNWKVKTRKNIKKHIRYDST